MAAFHPAHHPAAHHSRVELSSSDDEGHGTARAAAAKAEGTIAEPEAVTIAAVAVVELVFRLAVFVLAETAAAAGAAIGWLPMFIGERDGRGGVRHEAAGAMAAARS